MSECERERGGAGNILVKVTLIKHRGPAAACLPYEPFGIMKMQKVSLVIINFSQRITAEI